MLGNFFNKKTPKDFKIISSYSNRDKYFIRIKPWDWLNAKQIYVSASVDNKPSMITMDFWSQEIYLDADGQITVAELFEIAKKQYLDSKMDVPDELDKVIIESLESLVNDLRIVELRNEKAVLPEAIRLPMSKAEKSSSI